MTKGNYSGIFLQPDVDFSQVRDGRRSSLFYYDVDLSVARNVKLGTELILPVAGDSFYVDKNPSLVGPATVHFQDVTSGIAPAPVYCESGFIASVPFTRLLIENTAQPGKIFRFHYGIDIDFQPGTASTLTISGAVSVTTSIGDGGVICTPIFGPLNAATQLIAPTTNVSGINFYSASCEIHTLAASLATETSRFTVHASPSPNLTSGIPLTKNSSITLHRGGVTGVAGASLRISEINKILVIPAGWGVYCDHDVSANHIIRPEVSCRIL